MARLSNGFRRCIRCKSPYQVGTSPVTRYCLQCYENPIRNKNGTRDCQVCGTPFSSVGKTPRAYCSNECSRVLLKRSRDTLRGRLRLALQKARYRREVEFDLDWLEEQWHRQEGKCHYTGWNMQLSGPLALKPTLERIDSSKPYLKDNVVLVCRQANWAKNNYTLQEFIDMCMAVASRYASLPSDSQTEKVDPEEDLHKERS